MFSDVGDLNMCNIVSDDGLQKDASCTNSVTTPIELILSRSHEAEQRFEHFVNRDLDCYSQGFR